ncbi:MAG: phosphate ABC transporter permease PstA [Acidimicrobiia bacterium]|nr:phosphate ABC transporter permease PstA [Acidimicrobiia bacterium]
MALNTLTHESTSTLVRERLAGKKTSAFDQLVALALLLALLSALAVLIVLLADVVRKGMPVLTDRGFEFVTGRLNPEASEAGILQGIMGSLALTVFVLVIAFPVGVGAAIYLEEYAHDNRVTRIIQANIRNLAGVPSIVYGLLGLAVFVKLLGGMTGGRTVISGGLTLGVLVLPIMIITTAEAIRAVPQALREASYGVGATQWETIRHQVLPVAMPAILTGTVLTIARAFGESAPLLLAGARLSLFFSNSTDAGLWDLVSSEPYTALPIVVYNWARQPQKEFVELTAAAIIVLLILLLAVNAGAIVLRDRYERR